MPGVKVRPSLPLWTRPAAATPIDRRQTPREVPARTVGGLTLEHDNACPVCRAVRRVDRSRWDGD